MFTGIVEAIGTVTAIEAIGELTRLTIEAGAILEGIEIGDSIAVDGACLTVTVIEGECVSFEAVRETMERTSLGDASVGSKMNLERALRAGFREVNAGVLLGLSNWRKEVLFLGLHLCELQTRFPSATLGFSLPRMRPFLERSYAPEAVSDPHFVQALLALRILLPSAPAALSTRESATFRDHLIGLGITRMSAASTTQVGGWTQAQADHAPQFEIEDGRSVPDVVASLRALGFQALFKDWHCLEKTSA